MFGCMATQAHITVVETHPQMTLYKVRLERYYFRLPDVVGEKDQQQDTSELEHGELQGKSLLIDFLMFGRI